MQFAGGAEGAVVKAQFYEPTLGDFATKKLGLNTLRGSNFGNPQIVQFDGARSKRCDLA